MSTTSTVSGAGSPADPDATGRLDGASRRKIFTILAVIVLYTEVAPIQYTMIASALPKIAPSFPAAGPNITWAMIVFGLVGASAAPLVGKMSDIWGKKRMFLICGALFAIGCLVTATTTSWPIFLVGRCLQSVAAAMAVVAYGLIRDLLPHKYVPLGLGISATGLGFSAALAPLLAGYFVDNYSWRAMFWVLFAFTVVMTPLVMFVVPESRLRVSGRLDIAGAALLSGGVALVLIYIAQGHQWGWNRPTTLAWPLVGLAMLIAFGVVEKRSRTPIIEMKLLLSPRVSLVLITALLTSCMIGVHAYAVSYMVQIPDQATLTTDIVSRTVDQVVEMTGRVIPVDLVNVTVQPGYSYGDGLSLMEFALRIAIVQGLVGMVFGVVAGIAARRVGPRLPLLVALLLFLVVAVALVVLPHTWQVFAVASAAFGAGFGLYYACMPILMVEAVPQERQGISVGMLGVMQSLGTAIGTAVVTGFVSANPITASVSVAGQPARTQEVPNIFADRGYELGFWFGALVVLGALMVALVMKHGRTAATGGALSP
ncbi:MFS transporter [Nocardia rhizosphaerihabitans]|uniref:MFS transporter n=1 Tax=Nocardia rhizosphaerihabitans TaxID=1691570 RepID=UPI0036704A39